MAGKKEWLIRKVKKHYLGPFDTDQIKKLIRNSEISAYDEIARSSEGFRYVKDSPLFAPFIQEAVPHAIDEKTVNLSLEETVTATGPAGAIPRNKKPLLPKRPVIELEKIEVSKREKKRRLPLPLAFLLIGVTSAIFIWAVYQKQRGSQSISPSVAPPGTQLQELTQTLEQFNFYFYQGRLEESAEEYDRAIELYEKALEYKPDDHRAKINLAMLSFRKSGDIQKTRQTLLKLLPGVSEKTSFVEVQNNLGLLSLKQNRMDEAIPYFLRAIREDPQFLPAHFNLGYSYFIQKQFYNARLYFDKGAKTQANFPMLYIYLGRTLERLGKDDAAIREYLNANRINPNLYASYIHLAMVHLKLKQKQQAFDYLSRMVSKDPDYQRYLAHDFRFIEETFDIQSAIDAIVAEKIPTAEVATAIAALFYLGREYKKAKEWVEKALSLNPEAPAPHVMQGYLSKREGEYDRAYLSFQTALRYQYENGLAHIQLADLSIQLGRYQQAIEHCRKVFVFDPSSVAAYYTLGVTFTHLDRISDAVDSFNKALEYDPNYLPAKKQLLQYSK